MKLMPSLVPSRSKPGETSLPPAPDVASAAHNGASQRMVRTGVFSIFDQGVVSGASFFTTLIIARSCSQEELGVYALAWTIVVFLAAVQGNLITVPYTMYCHRRSGEALAEYAGSTLAHQLITSVAAVACFLGLGILLSFGLGPERLWSAAWVLFIVSPFLLLREYVRRFTFAHLAPTIAITIDVIVAALQLGALLALCWLGLLSAAVVYSAMGAACAVGCLCWWFLDRQPMRFSRKRISKDWARNWSFGKWALASQVTGLGTCLLPWILATVHGEAAAGEFAACATLVGLSNLFVTGLNNFLTPKAAHAFADRSIHALSNVLRKATLCFVVVLGGLCLALLVGGHALAGMVYGHEYADTGSLIAVLGLATFADALGLVAGIGLWAMDRPSATFGSDVVQLLVTLGVAFGLVFSSGAMGIAIAMVIGRTAGAVARWATLWTLMRFQPCEARAA